MRLLDFKTIAVAIITSAAAVLQVPGTDNRPVAPYKIADHLYNVGASDIASYLITTTAGHILIDGGYEATVPIIESNVTAIGFNLRDVKILLNTQAHTDHAGGLARLKTLTGARLMMSERDAPIIEAGGRGDFVLTEPQWRFPAATVDRRLRDGDLVRLGSTTLTARLTPGHTKGCTTWTFDATDRGRTYHVVVLCGLTVLEGTRVSGMPAYPTIESDYERTFEVLKRMPIDIFLGAHPSYYDGMKKADALRAKPDGPNPFVDPDGFHAFVANAERRFRERLTAEKKSKR